MGADLAEQYPAFLRYRRNGLACVLRFFSAAELPAELAEWALSLTRAHMAVGRRGPGTMLQRVSVDPWQGARHKRCILDARGGHPGLGRAVGSAGRGLVRMRADPLPFPNLCPWQDLYNACPGWGWSDAKKRAELTHPSARLLVLFEEAAPDKAALPSKHCGGAAGSSAGSRPSAAAAAAAGDAAARQSGSSQENAAAAGNGGGGGTHAARGACCEAARGGDCVRQWHQDQRGQPVAFLHYRFEEEEGEAVLYCYEIQVAQAAQVGRQLACRQGAQAGTRCGNARAARCSAAGGLRGRPCQCSLAAVLLPLQPLQPLPGCHHPSGCWHVMSSTPQRPVKRGPGPSPTPPHPPGSTAGQGRGQVPDAAAGADGAALRGGAPHAHGLPRKRGGSRAVPPPGVRYGLLCLASRAAHAALTRLPAAPGAPAPRCPSSRFARSLPAGTCWMTAARAQSTPLAATGEPWPLLARRSGGV